MTLKELKDILKAHNFEFAILEIQDFGKRVVVPCEDNDDSVHILFGLDRNTGDYNFINSQVLGVPFDSVVSAGSLFQNMLNGNTYSSIAYYSGDVRAKNKYKDIRDILNLTTEED